MWQAELDPDGLSQGDIVEDLLIAAPVCPIVSLVKRCLPKNEQGWVERTSWRAGADGIGQCLSSGRLGAAIVLSHSCELDKERKKPRALVAPVALASGLNESTRALLFARRRRALLPLPGLPEIGDCYADLRAMVSMDRRHLDACRRIGSMTQKGIDGLHRHLVTFLTRFEEHEDVEEAAEDTVQAPGAPPPIFQSSTE